MHGVVLLAVRIDLGNDAVKVGVRPERALRGQLLATRRTLLVAGPERRDDTVVAEAVQTLLGRHRPLQNVQADRTEQLILQDLRRDGDLGVIVDDFVRDAVHLILIELPVLCHGACVLITPTHFYVWLFTSTLFPESDRL